MRVRGEVIIKMINPKLLKFAKNMRHSSTDAENLMWQILRARRFMDLKFRRQHVIKPYIVDFSVMKFLEYFVVFLNEL